MKPMLDIWDILRGLNSLLMYMYLALMYVVGEHQQKTFTMFSRFWPFKVPGLSESVKKGKFATTSE